MARQTIISIDIGSTYTKGALFVLDTKSRRLYLDQRETVPTTAHNLSEGFGAVWESLGGADHCAYSSSAKGGLKITAIGLVPKLTVETSRVCAMCAGGKLTGSYAYKLTEPDIRDMEDQRPDVVLISGGTDGGDEAYVRHNLKMLSSLSVDCQFIYAGNRTLQPFAQACLGHRALSVTDNILPDLDQPNIQPARETIRQVFLDRIVSGKGLGPIAEMVGKPPLPTPLAMYELLKSLPKSLPDWDRFCVVDMGGATTDVYSFCQPALSDVTVIQKGIPSPAMTRTVEGDLGLRVSATAACAAAALHAIPLPDFEAMQGYARRLEREPDSLPNTSQERDWDKTLATLCFDLALQRHAGTCRSVFTPLGEQFIQEGKDLRPVTRLIGTGGYLSHCDTICPWPPTSLSKAGGAIRLLPEAPEYWIDTQYMLPLLANLFQMYPRETVDLAATLLTHSSWNSHSV